MIDFSNTVQVFSYIFCAQLQQFYPFDMLGTQLSAPVPPQGIPALSKRQWELVDFLSCTWEIWQCF